MLHRRSRPHRHRPLQLGAPLVVAVLALAACGSDSKSSSTTAGPATTAASAATTAAAPASTPGTTPGELTSLTIGYSAWPGWFPLAVADKEGIFTDAGLNVDLKYFADYTASLDALVAGQLDVNAQTLNDTIFAVASGADQKIVVTGDNSTGNDAVICDESITSIEDLKGKTVAAEAGVVDHFLLLQGLATKGMTEQDISFQGVKTDAAAAAFAGGQFDCVAVFAPFTLQALERDGIARAVQLQGLPRHDPGSPRGHAPTRRRTRVAMQKLVDAWYKTLDYIAGQPRRGHQDHGRAGAASPIDDYESWPTAPRCSRRPGAVGVRRPCRRPDLAGRRWPAGSTRSSSSSGLAETEADLSDLFDPLVHEGVRRRDGLTSGATTVEAARRRAGAAKRTRCCASGGRSDSAGGSASGVAGVVVIVAIWAIVANATDSRRCCRRRRRRGTALVRLRATAS